MIYSIPQMYRQYHDEGTHMRTVKFDLRVSPEERRLIDLLAEREERSASDAIRRLIRQAVQSNERAPKDGGALVVSRP